MIEGYSDVKMKVQERHFNICTDTEWQQDDQKCIPKLYEGDRPGCSKRVFIHTEIFVHFHTRFYTQMPLGYFTHRLFYTQAPLLTDAFTHSAHRRFYTKTILHTGAFAQRPFYTQTLVHKDPFTQRPFYSLLHTDAFPHRRFTQRSQTLLHKGAFTHTDAFRRLLQRRVYTQAPSLTDTRVVRQNPSLPHFFNDRTSFVAKVLPRTIQSRNFYPSLRENRKEGMRRGQGGKREREREKM